MKWMRIRKAWFLGSRSVIKNIGCGTLPPVITTVRTVYSVSDPKSLFPDLDPTLKAIPDPEPTSQVFPDPIPDPGQSLTF